MQLGFVIDGLRNGTTEAKWAEGAPEKSFWLGLKLKGKHVFPIQAFRCPRCGFLAHYAVQS